MARGDNTVGGTKTYTFALAAELRKLKCLVTILGTGSGGNDDDIPFVSVSTHPVRSNLEFHRRLRAWVRRHPLDTPAVIDAQRPDFLAPFFRHSARVALVCTIHGDPAMAVQFHRPIMSRAYERLERTALVESKHVISVSGIAMRQYVARYPFLASKISMIPVGVSLETFRPLDRDRERERLGVPDGPVLLYAGRLEPEKRVDVLFDAVATMNRPPLVLVAGTGRREAQLRRRAVGHPIRFLGNVPHDKMPSVISAADALVLPSAFEGTPTIAIEALACGVPVIATPVGDLPLIVKPGKTGCLFDGTVASLRQLLEGDLAAFRTFARECINTGKRFSWDRVAGDVREVLRAAAV